MSDALTAAMSQVRHLQTRLADAAEQRETLIAARDAAVDAVEGLEQKCEALRVDWSQAEAEIARLSSQLSEAQQNLQRASVAHRAALKQSQDNYHEARQQEDAKDRLSSQLAGMREALTEVRSVVAVNAAASHMLEGFTIGPNGLPASRPRRITHEDALLAKVDAALHAAQGSPTKDEGPNNSTRIGQPDERPTPQRAATDTKG